MTKVALIALNDINRYPAFFYIADKLSKEGNDVTLLSRQDPEELAKSLNINIKFRWVKIKNTNKIISYIPILKGNSHGILADIIKIKPDWVIGQHQYSLVGTLYKILKINKEKVYSGVYFSDYIEKNLHEKIIKKLSKYLDLYIDVCDLRVQWRIKDWPDLQCKKIVIRQATPVEKNLKLEKHYGQTKVLFTGSDYGIGMNWNLLEEFINKLCNKGIRFDWYLPGPDSVRKKAKLLSKNHNYNVFSPVGKSELLNLQKNYDFGLFWAPCSNETIQLSRSIYASAASNKICEYQSSGLGIIHTGNPGLNYLPSEISFKIDPWNTDVSVSELIDTINNRALVEKIRKKSLEYHRTTMNSDKQIEPLSQYIKELSHDRK